MTAVALARGQNTALPTTDLSVEVKVPAAADISALLLTADGKVRGDADIVFFNQQEGPGVRCIPPNNGAPWQLKINLAQVPADIEKVRVVTSLDEAGRTFGSLPSAPVALVSDANGAPVASADLDGLSTEAIVIAVEFYRRGGDWKLRSVGQGYAGGLAGLLRDHGVDVADEPAATPPPASAAPTAAAPVQAPPPAPPSPPAQTPPAPQHDPYAAAPPPQAPAAPPQHDPYGSPPPQAPAAQHDPYAAPPAPYGAAPQGNPYGQPPTGGPRQAPPPPPQAPAGQPHDPYAPQPSTPAPAQGPALTRGRPVNLSKGQSVNLRKDDGGGLTYVRMGLGWDPVRRGGRLSRRTAEVDLDASAVMMAGPDLVDVAFYNRLATADGSVRHSGDNRTGEGDGDDESITIDLARVPVHVTSIILVVTSYEGHTFQMVENAFCRLIDEGGRNGELVRYQLAGGAPSTGMVMAALRRDGQGWRMQAIGEPVQARTPHETFQSLHRFAQ